MCPAFSGFGDIFRTVLWNQFVANCKATGLDYLAVEFGACVITQSMAYAVFHNSFPGQDAAKPILVQFEVKYVSLYKTDKAFIHQKR